MSVLLSHTNTHNAGKGQRAVSCCLEQVQNRLASSPCSAGIGRILLVCEVFGSSAIVRLASLVASYVLKLFSLVVNILY